MLSTELSPELVSGALLAVLTILLGLVRAWRARLKRQAECPEPPPPPPAETRPVLFVVPSPAPPNPDLEIPPPPLPEISKEDLWLAYQLQRGQSRPGWVMPVDEGDKEPPKKRPGRPRKRA